jgi:hypothetical protein
LKPSAGEREHVDQPAWTAGDAPGAKEDVDLAVADRAGMSEVGLADLKQQR